MKVKVLSRNPDDFRRETKRDIQKLPRNYDPALHPFEAPREYTRALNATKLERVFAKPFLGSLDGHRDGVHCMCKHPTSLSLLLSGSYDGEIRLWNLPKRKCVRAVAAHEGYVRGMCYNPSGDYFYSCGDDKIIKQWSMEEPGYGEHMQPTNTILGKTIFHAMDHHWQDNVFATAGQQMDIWDEERSEPMRSFTWGVDSLNSVKFNPIETHILGATASDRSIILYDMRGSAPLRKVILKLRSNTIAWNPMEAFMFTAANEDYNLYSFDMRRLDRPLNIHMDHVSAVLDVDYSPTGKEFVSGSYDKSIRIFPVDKGHSREVYHTKRMQRVICVKWSSDNKYLLSGSDEMNIRVWKARASEKIGVLRPREKEAFAYSEKLKEKFSHHPQVRRISRHRHVPKMIYNASKEIREIKASRKRKEANRRAHSKPGTVPFVPERKKHVVGEVK
ncbi:DDB1- and CUL4-associated factor 13 isoform X2 [Lingula anatina]|uniref:DDB1- and CUL4-associated factor 13 n=1 Tax=Lingula anatina TaxID=7574 RepID=A0A1S3K776_LINAN|nr:DDB1- and CUL4-associated factor 13 isoform X2 [Lingula anatina]|eukprot:XP_013418347.1 DDB1- and CUL4-associated factor 13 isoform X2 [Lingula anatina]